MQGFEGFVLMLAARFEQRAVDRDREGGMWAAGVYRRVADELRDDFAAWRDQEVTPEEGARLSNYSANGLRAYMKRHGLTRLTVGTLPFRPLVAALDMDEGPDAEPVAEASHPLPRRVRALRPRPTPTLSGAVLATLRPTGAR